MQRTIARRVTAEAVGTCRLLAAVVGSGIMGERLAGFPENTASLALHERCGFRVVGVYQHHGKLEGEWRDCVIVERPLDEDTRTGTT